MTTNNTDYNDDDLSLNSEIRRQIRTINGTLVGGEYLPTPAVVKDSKPMKKKIDKAAKQFKNGTPEPRFIDGLKVINIHRHLIDNIPAATRLLETSIYPRVGKGKGICLRFRSSVASAKLDRVQLFLKDLADFAASNKAKILIVSTSAQILGLINKLFVNNIFETRKLAESSRLNLSKPKKANFAEIAMFGNAVPSEEVAPTATAINQLQELTRALESSAETDPTVLTDL